MDLKPVDWSKVECCFVYCYLREKDQTPYYVGIAKRRDRITAHHTVHIPANRAYIRCMRSGLTHEEAQAWEQFYIAHYGRKEQGPGFFGTRRMVARQEVLAVSGQRRCGRSTPS